MVGKTEISNTATTDSTKLRKVRKPLIEKKRRDRINNSLSQLKDLLAKTTKQNGSAAIARLDKADILEMTVRYLTQCQEHQSQSRETTSYSRGFKDCTRETMRYLRVSNSLGNDQICSLNSYLFGVYVAETESEKSSEIRSIPAVQKILNGHVKPVHRSRGRGISTAGLEIKREVTSPFTPESNRLDELKRSEQSADIGPVVCEESVWRPW